MRKQTTRGTQATDLRFVVLLTLVVLGPALLGGSVATHASAGPDEPDYNHDLRMTHESTDAYAAELENSDLEPADAIDYDDLGPVTRVV